MGVGALDLVLGIGQEGFEVVVGGGHPVDEVFEYEGESVLNLLDGFWKKGKGGGIGDFYLWRSSWDSVEMEKTRLLTAARLSLSSTAVISSSSFLASWSETAPSSFGLASSALMLGSVAAASCLRLLSRLSRRRKFHLNGLFGGFTLSFSFPFPAVSPSADVTSSGVSGTSGNGMF